MRESFVPMFLFGCVFGFWIGLLAVTTIQNAAWQRDAIARDLAMFCPANGEWAWKGECK